MSLLLVFVLCAGLVPGMSVQAAVQTRNITVSMNINMGGKEFTITADIYYDVDIVIDKAELLTLAEDATLATSAYYFSVVSQLATSTLGEKEIIA